MEKTDTTTHTPDRQLINRFVIAFYSSVREDPTIGPIFNEAIGNHWAAHFETLTDFWVTVLLGVHVYKGNPFLVHKQLPTLRNEHFDIWLQIFEDIAHKELYPDLATHAIEKAHRIATSLRQGLFFNVAE